MPESPETSALEVGHLSLEHLVAVVSIDSQSDETSPRVPSTPGQQRLSDHVAVACRNMGAEVEQDECANVYAWLPGRGAGAAAAPLALMVHLDTSKGTQAVDGLAVTGPWTGDVLVFVANPRLQVSVDTYPETREFLGQHLVHGPGDAPFGLDDKLGLAHCLTLLDLLRRYPTDHPPLLVVGRPDEEIGRFEALRRVVDTLRSRGVGRGYTVDGIAPFEVNVENFNAGRASVLFPWAGESAPGVLHGVHLGGVNTHGATAKAEGYRSALQLAAELVQHGITVAGFVSDEGRDCDASVLLAGERDALVTALDAVVGPHVARGASWRFVEGGHPRSDTAAARAIAFAGALLDSRPGFVVRASDSAGRDGYSNPFRILETEAGLQVDVRVRDFSDEGLLRRREHVARMAEAHDAPMSWRDLYVNMGPRLAAFPELVRWASEARGGQVAVQPIRGGTGVDPFLDAGVPVANLGTGYFAPESEKEFTSLEMMGEHALWLYRLVQVVAAG